MGPTTLVGVAVLILFVPLVERLTAQLLSIRNERVKMTDARVGIVSAMLQGVRLYIFCFDYLVFVVLASCVIVRGESKVCLYLPLVSFHFLYHDRLKSRN